MESYDLSAKKLRIIARLIKKAKNERVSFSLNTSSSFPEPIYHQNSPSDTLNLKELQEKLLIQTTLIDKLTRALRYCQKELKKGGGENQDIAQLKNLFKRKQNKVAHVLKKTLAELKATKEKSEFFEAEVHKYQTETERLIVDQHRLADGLERALKSLRAGRKASDFDSLAERKRIEEQVSQHYKTLIEEAEKKNLLLEARIKKDEETQSRLKKGFEDVLTGVKKEFENQLLAKDAAFKEQLENQEAQNSEVQDYKKQVALLKAHLEGILIDKKKLEQTLRSMRQTETAPLENKLKELEVLLQTKEDELTHIQRHLGRKIQEIAGLQDMLQEQENKTQESEKRLENTFESIEELKSKHLRDQGFLNEEIASLKDLLDQKALEIDSLHNEIARLRDVEDDFEKMKESISLLQQNLLRVK